MSRGFKHAGVSLFDGADYLKTQEAVDAYLAELPDGVHLLSPEGEALAARMKETAARAEARFTKRES